MKHLVSMGFGPDLLRQLDPDLLPDPPVARVSFTTHANVRLILPDGREVPGLVDRTLHDRADPVLVGDWVLARPGDPYIVTHRFERRAVLRRRDPGGGVQRVAANVDVALLCMPADQPVNQRRLERWVAVAADAEVPLVVALTRVDLVDPATVDAAVADVAEVCDAPCVPVSAATGAGLDALAPWSPAGATLCLLGQSGVGKSTLTNRLLGVDAQDTGDVRGDGRGRHTTTQRRLLRLPGGAWLLDNPGVRGVGLVDDAQLGAAFPEVDALLGRCRFRDCDHDDATPGCALVAAVAEGAVRGARLDAWRKLQREIAYEARKGDPRAAADERARWKRIHKAQRQRDKARGR